MVRSLHVFSPLAAAFAKALPDTQARATNNSFDLKPFKIDLTSEIPHLMDLLRTTHLPEKALYPDVGPDKGIELDFLRDLRSEWMGSFSWEAVQAELNQFTQYTAVIEGLTVHFVHEKSKDPNAIPLLLLHGWPGSFHEFSPVIKPLTESWRSTSGKNVSFNVIVPSLPGFVFSSAPPLKWTLQDDTPKIFNMLMTEVLGYSTYAVHGTDLGSITAYSLYESFNATVRAAHFVFIPFFPPSAQELAAKNISLSEVQQVAEERFVEWMATENGYDVEQTTKPNDIGLALYDNPVGQLAWIANNMKLWSDPRAGTPPSVLNSTAILTSISLYYLTHSFLSAAWSYAQNPAAFRTVYTKAPTDAPMLYSQYKYAVGMHPEEYVAKVGNLVAYKEHDFGGHFAGLDNPPSVIEDLRELGEYF
ncbi:Alpha/Beta hydrolase protein [Mycena latifolia]|nr:Alpha/Beta hydrolase protein [Mycena latifolia]